MCQKIRQSVFVKLSMILAACQFSACASRAPAEKPAEKPAVATAVKAPKCTVSVKQKGVGCVQAVNDYENSYEVKLIDDTTFYSIPNAGNMKEEDLLILKGARDGGYPVRLRLKGKEILGVQKLK